MKNMKLKRTVKQQLTGILFALPLILGIIFFFVYPLVSSFYYSLTDFNGVTVNHFLGMDNYISLFQDQDGTFMKSVQNTLIFTVIAVPINLVLGFITALLLNQNIRFKGVFRVIAYLPVLVPLVATTIIWTWILDAQYGIVNDVIMRLGGQMVPWLIDPDYVMPSLILINTWFVGGGTIIFLAGLQDIPSMYYEVATLDGANAWQRLRKITLPLMSPVLFFQLITNVIGALQQFTIPYVMYGKDGGPMNAGLFYNAKLYSMAFYDFLVGKANAMAWLMFLVIILITMVLYLTSKRWVHYMGE